MNTDEKNRAWARRAWEALIEMEARQKERYSKKSLDRSLEDRSPEDPLLQQEEQHKDDQVDP